MTEREFAIEVVRVLQNAGYQALWAGGCVRDELLGLVPKDYDVATNAVPEVVRKLFPRTVAVGISFGVVEILGPKNNPEPLVVQVATFRSDGSYSDGRRPDRVVFSTAEEDAERRDFTINGMFFDPIADHLIDYVGGQSDLKKGILRAIGTPKQRIEEDKLRMLRAVRIATRFHLTIESETANAIRAMANQVTVVSSERITEEIRKLLVDPERLHGLDLLEDLHLLAPLFPMLLPLQQTPATVPDQKARTLWEHTRLVLGHLGKDVSFPLAFAVLCHEITPPGGKARGHDGYYEKLAKAVGQLASDMRCSNAERNHVVWLIAHQNDLCNARQKSHAFLKRIFVSPYIDDLLRFAWADQMAMGLETDDVQYCRQLLAKWDSEDIDPPPICTGEDLQALGLSPGPHFRTILEAVRDAQLNGEITDKDVAMAMAKKLAELS